MKIEKVMLINTDNDAELPRNANGDSFPPLGIISLGTVLKNRHQVNICLMDGQVDDIATIERRMFGFSPDLVGISVYSTSIRASIRLLKYAKTIGAVTVAGNDHILMHYTEYLNVVPELDYACLNDVGEETLSALVDHLTGKISINTVPLLGYRDATGNIKVTPERSSIRPGRSLDTLPIPDRNLLPLRDWRHDAERFSAQARSLFSFDKPIVTTINRARGCAQRKSRCVYCGIADLSIRYSSGLVFWEDVQSAMRDIGASVFYEAFDSASSAPKVLEEWYHTRPSQLEPHHFKFYAQACESDSRVVQVLKSLNTFCVNMGLDSGDERTLKLLKGKRHSIQQNVDALLRYKEAGIEVYTSFVLLGLGSDKETKRSLDQTITFIKWMLQNTSVVSFDCALLYPDRNAPVGRAIWEGDSTVLTNPEWNFLDVQTLTEVGNRWKGRLFIDPMEICSDFARACGVSPYLLMDYEHQIERLASSTGFNYGRSQGG
ncbi:MAG: cobalamin B12-binding domain-containing protein [Pseudomonadales bacterium]|nr:cobalamin B12-binding domain-containing protein [Pseudomonadales bacterium]